MTTTGMASTLTAVAACLWFAKYIWSKYKVNIEYKIQKTQSGDTQINEICWRITWKQYVQAKYIEHVFTGSLYKYHIRKM